MKLHELDQLFTELENEFEAMDGTDLTPELEQRILDLLAIGESLSTEYKDKIDNYCRFISNLEAMATARKAEADRLANLARIDQQKADFLKARLKDSLKSRDIKKVQTTAYNVSVCNNSVASVYYDQENVPIEYLRVKTEVDTKRIAEALKAGVEIPGAGFNPKGDHLRIK